MRRDESLHRLQDYTDTQAEQEDSVEERTQQLCPLPAEREILGGVTFL